MAEKTNITEKTEAATKKNEVLVPVFIEKGYHGEEENYLVSINGTNYLFPRGETSYVPPHVAYEIERSRKAQRHLDKKQKKMEEAANKINFG